MTRGRGRGAARWGVAVWCGLAAAACSDGNRVADRVSCYPACLADIVAALPDAQRVRHDGRDECADLRTPTSATGVAACFASGEKRWEATNATTADSVVVVKHADGSECYTATSQGASMRYTISVGGQNVAELNADAHRGARGGHLQRNDDDHTRKTPDCFRLPWTSAMACEQAPGSPRDQRRTRPTGRQRRRAWRGSG